MAKELTVGGTTYNYPEDGDAKGWGQEATAWAEAVTIEIDELRGSNDITRDQSDIDPSTGTYPTEIGAQNVEGLIFNAGTTQSATVQYNVYRASASASKVESGTMELMYDDFNTTWTIAVQSNGDAGVAFSVDATTGQVKYTSDALASQTTGTITFRAKVLEK